MELALWALADGAAHLGASSTGESNASHPNHKPCPNAGHRRLLPRPAAPRREIRRPRPSIHAESADEEQDDGGGAVRAAPRGPVGADHGLTERRFAALRRVVVPLPGIPLLPDKVQDGARADPLRVLLPPRLRRRHHTCWDICKSSLWDLTV